MFQSGQWSQLVEISALASEATKWSSMKRRRTEKPDISRRANRVLRCVLDGELSAGRQALEGAELAPGSEATKAALTHPEKRPKTPREPLPDRIAHHQPECPVDIDEQLFAPHFEDNATGSSRRAIRHDFRTSPSPFGQRS